VKQSADAGSASMVAVKFDTTRPNFIRTTQAGDSGYIIVRPGQQGTRSEVIFRSSDQWMNFDLPKRIGFKYPNCVTPYDAVDLEHEIKDKDIVIVFTDGISDNTIDPILTGCVDETIDPETELLVPSATRNCIQLNASELAQATDGPMPLSFAH
jgi:hypothetical protein